ncbi:TRAP transporter large permease [Notoacmeibacter sp. MSK16QG-6]|uniref:TRAP transporter large permease n=1 Tax=Notoacmeibacter sp. MSK16QG-6 TaxID=2957982 RepID=UPI00209FEC1A|nr:TRAP transporter large permease [Notoacmeibacter sp. MSK16QG-6]MCP1199577.1 TRAP transporter large permease [Notoacmeibacter sp. MSK16QG-6]
MSLWFLFGAVFLLAILQVPISISMLAGALLWMLLDGGLPISIVAQRMAPSLDSFPLLAVPLFVLAGNLLNRSGIAERIFEFAGNLVGHIRGGLAHVNILASLIFSGMSGVAQADAAGLGTVEIKAMKKAGYSSEFSAAITAVSAIIGPIIPPSVIMVIYAVLAGVSVADLFLAGIVPGLILTLALSVTTYLIAFRQGDKMPRSPRASFSMVASSFWRALPGLLAPTILIAGLLLGIATPTELGAIIVLYAVLLGLIYGELKLRDIKLCLADTVITTGVLLFIIAAAAPFAWLIAVLNVPQHLAGGITGLTTDFVLTLLLINVGLLIAGLFIETTAILIVAVPALLPIAMQIGLDPVQFGVMIVFNLMIGTLTPPFGIILFIMMDIAKVRLFPLMRQVTPFYASLFGMLGLITFVPTVTLWLPGLVRTMLAGN